MAKDKPLPPGLRLRGKKYYSDFRDANGDRIREPLSTNLNLAVEMLARLKRRVEMAGHGMLDNSAPWAEIRDTYLEWLTQAGRRTREQRADIRDFETWCPVRYANEITPSRMVKYRTYLATFQRKRSRRNKETGEMETHDIGAIGARTINRKVGTIRAVLNNAVEMKLIADNPIKGLESIKGYKPVKVRRSLTAEETRRVLFAIAPLWRPMIRFIVGTGCRHGEATMLKWDQLDLARGTVSLRDWESKGKKTRVVPLDIELWEWLKAHRVTQSPASEIVFANSRGKPRTNNALRIFYSACRKVGIDDGKPRGSVDIHSLRVTFTTLSLDAGANPRDVQAILGHSTLALTMGTYAKTRETSQRKVVDNMPWSQNGPKQS